RTAYPRLPSESLSVMNPEPSSNKHRAESDVVDLPLTYTPPATPLSANEAAAIRDLATAYRQMKEQIGRVIVGQTEVVQKLLMARSSRGHCLLVGVPGLAKTLLVSTVSKILHLTFKRVQFTPDLMPADITGTDILQDDPETGRRKFVFLPGPIFANMI